MLSQQDQEMWPNVPDPSFAGGSHFCGSGAGNETTSSCALTREQRKHSSTWVQKMSSNGKKRSKKGKRKGKQKAEPVSAQELEEQKEMEDKLLGAALWYSVTVDVD